MWVHDKSETQIRIKGHKFSYLLPSKLLLLKLDSFVITLVTSPLITSQEQGQAGTSTKLY